jgi:hypothetical protein
MDIAALASVMKHSAMQQQVSLSVKKIAMDAAKGQAVDLTQMLQQSAKAMELSVNPNLGGNIDIRILEK